MPTTTSARLDVRGRTITTFVVYEVYANHVHQALHTEPHGEHGHS